MSVTNGTRQKELEELRRQARQLVEVGVALTVEAKAWKTVAVFAATQIATLEAGTNPTQSRRDYARAYLTALAASAERQKFVEDAIQKEIKAGPASRAATVEEILQRIYSPDDDERCPVHGDQPCPEPEPEPEPNQNHVTSQYDEDDLLY